MSIEKKIAEKSIEARINREKESLIYEIIGQFGKQINDELASKLRDKADEFARKNERLMQNIYNLSKK